MSIQAVGAVIELRGIPPVQKLVLALLANAHNGHTGQCNPDQKRLAEECGISERSIRDHLNWLEEEGYISRTVTQLGRGEGKRTDFELLFLHRQILPEQQNAPEAERQCSGSSASLLRQTVAVDIDKPEYNRKEPEDRFEDAWKLYNSTKLKVGQTKKTAKAQWPKAVKRAGSPERLLEAIELEIAKRRSPKGFVPNLRDMHRWLRDDCWQDAEREAKPRPAPAANVADTLTDLERAFQTLAQTGDWMGDRIGHPIHPNRPDAAYPAELYARFQIKQQGVAA